MAFLCVCPEKSIDMHCDDQHHTSLNAFKDSDLIKKEFIQGILQSVSFNNKEKCTRILPGGGITIEITSGNEFKIALDNDVISALTGTITNYAYLVKKYLQKELNLPQNVTLEAIRDRIPVSEAELLCKLFYQMGTTFLSKLRGKFSFCIYDSKTVRILAARDASGHFPLYQGNLSDNTLFIASSSSYPSDASNVTEIEPGHYKFGWKSLPKKFMNPEAEMKHSAEIASNAANEALAGLLCKSSLYNSSGHYFIHKNNNKSHRRSYEEPKSSSSKKKVENKGRNSLDSQMRIRRHNNNKIYNVEHNHNKKKSSVSHRADEQTWWRAKKSPPSQHNNSDSSEELQNQDYFIKLKHNINEITYEFIKELTETLNMFLSTSIDIDKKIDNNIIKNLCKEKGINSALVITDSKDNIIYVNEKFENDTGYLAHEVMGKNCRFLQSKPGEKIKPSKESKEIRRKLDENKTFKINLVNYRKDGTSVQNRLLIVPIHDIYNFKIIYRVGFLNISPYITKNNLNDIMEASDNKLSTKSLTKSQSCGELAKREHQSNRSDAPSHHHNNAHEINLAF